MNLMRIRQLRKTFGMKTVLDNVNLDINSNEKVGLVGRNGTGKTTLANIIFGIISPDTGEVTRFNQNLNISYLKQSTSIFENDFSKMMEENHPNSHDFFMNSRQLGLGGSKGWNEERLSNLSGGEQTKIALARVWSHDPELLILDEPTNHLDFKSVEWLVQQLKQFNGATIIISHDRYFLDQCVEKIVEVEDGKLHEYVGNYTDYRKEKEKQFKNKLHQYEEQKKKELKIQREIGDLKNWSQQAHDGARQKAIETGMKFGGKEFYRSKAKKRDKQVKSKIKRLERLREQGLEKPTHESNVSFDFQDVNKRGKRIIEVKDVSKTVGGNNLFSKSSLYIKSGEPVGILGPNGCGKTTFVKMVVGEESIDEGEIWVSPSVEIGYLSQDVMDMDGSINALETIVPDPLTTTRLQAQSLLNNLGITGESIHTPIGNLSLGERTKIKLARLMMRNYPFLILDEPTNHLDLQSREQLERTLLHYNGTLLIVSHDRYFLESVCEKMIVFQDGKLTRFEREFHEVMEQELEARQNRVHDKGNADQQLLIENELARVLGLLQNYTPEDKEYKRLDEEFKVLLKKKNELS